MLMMIFAKLFTSVAAVLLIGPFALFQHTGRTDSPQTVESVDRQLGDGCQVYKTTASMPEPLKQAFVRLTGLNSFVLANPGQPFQVTDVVVTGENLPLRRLILSGQCGRTMFIHYERGGIALSTYLVLFHSGELSFAGGTSGIRRATSIEELRKSIKDARFTTDKAIYW